MGRSTCENSPRFSPYKSRSPFGIISKKFNSVFSSAMAIGSGLRRSLTRVVQNKKEKPSFASMPLEIAYHLFDLVKAEQLLQLCSIDHAHMKKVVSYLDSERFADRLRSMLSSANRGHELLTLPEVQAMNGADSFAFSPSALAQIIRTCHVANLTDESSWVFSAQFIIKLYMKVGSYRATGHDHYFWGKLISKTAVDWTQLEFYNFLQNFARVTGLRFRAEAFLLDDWETDKDEELILRNFIRPLFLECCNAVGNSGGGDVHFKGRAQEMHFRLSSLLNIFSTGSLLGHRFILLLGAPISVDANNQKTVDYQRISTEPIHDIASAKAFLGDIPWLVEQLLLTDKLGIEELRWTELEVFNFLEMLTTYPEPWVLRNFASLLVASPQLARIAVYIRALHGDPSEAGNTLFSCIEASVLLGYSPSILFHDTMFALHSKCTLPSRLTVIREAISTANLFVTDILGPNNNNPQQQQQLVNPNAVDLATLKSALEANRQITGLFITQINQINP